MLFPIYGNPMATINNVRDNVAFVSTKGTKAFAVLRHVNAKELLGTRIFGQAGDGLLQTALATFVLFSPQRETDPRKIALAFGILLLPYSVVGPFVGVFIDRWSRRQILIRANLVRVVTMVAIAIVITQHSANRWLALLVLVSLGVNRFVQAALSASLPHVVASDDLVPANALFPTLGTTAASISAALGIGAQKVFSNSDTVNAVLVVSGALMAGTASLVANRISPRDVLGPFIVESQMREEFRNTLRGLVSGFRYMGSSSRVLRSMFAVSFQRCAFGALTVHALLLSRSTWHTATNSDQAVTDFGLCAGAAALGAFTAAILSAFLLSDRRGKSEQDQVQQPQRQVNLIFAMSLATVFAVVTTVIGYRIGSLLSICLTAAALGFAGQLLKINADTTIQRTIDDAHRGRVFSIFDMMINVALVLGISSYALISSLRDNINLGAMQSVVLLIISSGLSLLLLSDYKKSAKVSPEV